jgi:hypothetical protein
MVFLGRDPVRCKIVVNNKCLQQIKNFKHPGFEISYENEKNIQQQVAKFAKILGILNNIFKPTFIQKFSRIKVYELALAILLYRSEIWTLRKRDKNIWHQLRLNFSEEQSVTYFLSTKGMKKFWKS